MSDWKIGGVISFAGPTSGVEWNVSKGTIYPTAGASGEVTIGIGGGLGGTVEFHPDSITINGNANVNIGPMISIDKVGLGIEYSRDLAQGDDKISVRVADVTIEFTRRRTKSSSRCGIRRQRRICRRCSMCSTPTTTASSMPAMRLGANSGLWSPMPTGLLNSRRCLNWASRRSI
jgi:hypothetical protein